ncbi:uncharacterized protein BJ171DRAFT_589720 [Polychytrium aggregatum]|uniref:uncharacterized protein n=1 Tax=Polychytrium aggregatum TaxID=110093 RepID=UPI0022FECC5A|nr:uncharacterized protein BJ171DRAFT_593291 [Polychytrium aggregatum]XP_052961623.1 uncharacterized protein BJ171DRAFT_616233 [Polychytrium aggregatum]XP_052961938.1 uncharacterized protein BJ171DRAFT_589720 [Polychytrium aggregatum]KAI9188499.1 hypothetical protein BJ171DRAFT_593291 [Polychytrium aggregatum]KAI9190646.1 hypothetical protein BJ171DRAFT_616233 [Polychytrium aggregatum]KAI9193000.1 hypothetical protein BJ171DRAFT_589720 [Polychytrium aggregatum]
MATILQSADRLINQSLAVLDNKWVSGFLRLFLFLYGGFAAPKLTASATVVFENPIFRVLVFFLIIIVANKDFALSLLLTFVFFTSTWYIENKLNASGSTSSSIGTGLSSSGLFGSSSVAPKSSSVVAPTAVSVTVPPRYTSFSQNGDSIPGYDENDVPYAAF